MNILMPMAGRGARFKTAGYTVPKPFIPVDGTPMIIRVVRNVAPGWPARFVFLCLSDFLEEFGDAFRKLLDDDGIDYEIISVDGVTEGAACTCLLAESKIDNDQELIIANCDQLVLDPQYMPSSIQFYRRQQADGGILCFLNDSPKWSYCRLKDGAVSEVVEKQVVSNIATVGIYYYRQGALFVEAAHRMIERQFRVNGEFYVAPTYNELIARGRVMIPYMVNTMVGLGTPEDLQAYLLKDVT